VAFTQTPTHSHEMALAAAGMRGWMLQEPVPEPEPTTSPEIAKIISAAIQWKTAEQACKTGGRFGNI